MSLITPSYFIDELHIPNTDKPEVDEALVRFITKYEEKFLVDVLGYELYTSFITGLQQPTINPVWLSILYGSSYTYYSRSFRWKGLLNFPAGFSSQILSGETISLVVGRGRTNDPVVNSVSTTIPASFVDVPVEVERRGFGKLISSEFSIVGNVLTLTDGTVFNSGETFVLSRNMSVKITTSSIGTPSSIIANYVYCAWMENEATQTTGVGETRSKTDNAVMVRPMRKICRAWNEMTDQVWQLVSFLDNKVVDYPLWEIYHNGNVGRAYWYYGSYGMLADVYSPKNPFNL